MHFFSRVIAGRQRTVFNHALFDVDSIQYNNQILCFKPLNLNGSIIKDLADPTDKKYATNKKYVDDEISKIPKAETDVLKLDGSPAMTRKLDMGDKKITELVTQDDVPITDYPNY